MFKSIEKIPKKEIDTEKQEKDKKLMSECILGLNKPGVEELIRFFESEKRDKITEEMIDEVRGYKPFEIEGEKFLSAPFSRSSEAASILNLVRLGRIDREYALSELRGAAELVSEQEDRKNN